MNESTPYCCFIDPVTEQPCPKDAVWQMDFPPDPYDFTHACDEHVLEFLADDKDHIVLNRI